jgi:tRNA-Thr(GGU) m(6)t(6)A37 methyltransferase TsaA
MLPSALPSLTLAPIGLARTPFLDRVSAPRQPYAAAGVPGTIELFPGHGYEHALSDLDGFDRLWILFWFHLNTGWRPKVLPPRSNGKRRGVFATRSPHRPNPIGLSVVRLDRISGLTLHILDIDMLDGTPILDIKPYVPYADAHPTARTGWLKPLAQPPSPGAESLDPEPGFDVRFTPLAAEQIAWLHDTHAIDLRTPIERTLALGPQPHPYRRIRRLPGDLGIMLLAVKDWRVRFHAEGRTITVESIATGYRPRQLATSSDPAVQIHKAYDARYGAPIPTAP